MRGAPNRGPLKNPVTIQIGVVIFQSPRASGTLN